MTTNFTGHALGWAAMPIRFNRRSPMANACERDTYPGRHDLQYRLEYQIRDAIRTLTREDPRRTSTHFPCARIHKLLPTSLPSAVLDYLILANLPKIEGLWSCPAYVSGGKLRIQLSDGRRLAIKRMVLEHAIERLQTHEHRRIDLRGPAVLDAAHDPDSPTFDDGKYGYPSAKSTGLLDWLNTSLHFNTHLFIVNRELESSAFDEATIAQLFAREDADLDPVARTRFLSPISDGVRIRMRGQHERAMDLNSACYRLLQVNIRFIGYLGNLED